MTREHILFIHKEKYFIRYVSDRTPISDKLDLRFAFMLLKTECVGSFPSPVSQTVGLRIAQNRKKRTTAESPRIIYNIVPYMGSHIHTYPLCMRHMYTATQGRVINIPTLGIYVAISSFAIFVKLRSLRFEKTSVK